MLILGTTRRAVRCAEQSEAHRSRLMRLLASAHPTALFVFFLLLSNAGQLFAKSEFKQIKDTGIRVPIKIEIATSLSGDESLKQGIFLFKVHCALGHCFLERLSLNECLQDKKGKFSFTPKLYSWTSQAGFLEANLSGNVLELDIFQAAHRQLPAKMILTFYSTNPPHTKLKSFKAIGFIDFLKWPDTDTRIEYIPLHGDQLKELDCPIFLPGIN